MPRATSTSTSCSRAVRSSSTRGVARGAPARSSRVAEGGDEARGHRGRDHAVAGGHDADAGDQVGGRRALEQEAAGAGLEALVHVLVEIEGGEDEDARALVAPQRDDRARRLDAVHDRHLHVHEHDVGVEAARQLHRLARRRRPRPTTSMSASVSRMRRSPERTICSSSASTTVMLMCPPCRSGRRARTAKPPSARGPASSSPLNVATRSRMPTQAAAARRRDRRRRRGRRRATSMRERVRLVAHVHRRVRLAGVLERVGQRLLDDAVGGEVEAGRQRPRLPLHAERHGQPGLADLLAQHSPSWPSPGAASQPDLRRRARAGCRACARCRPSAWRPAVSILPSASRASSRLGLDDALRGARVEHDDVEGVPDAVVQLAGQARALLGHRFAGARLAVGRKERGPALGTLDAAAVQPDHHRHAPRPPRARPRC